MILGSVSGKLTVGLPRKCWATFLPQLLAVVPPETPKEWVTLDLALVLVAEGYAVLQTGGENLVQPVEELFIAVMAALQVQTCFI